MASTPIEAPPLGLRERKKLKTRELIAETARTLFTERGFDAVTVSEVAAAAEISGQTVFNYFPRKEDLVYWRFGSFEEELLDAVRERGEGESVLAAFRGFLFAQRGLLGRFDPGARGEFVAMSRMITGSPALLAREREILDEVTGSLAALIAAEQGAGPDELGPWVAANAMIGLHRRLIGFTRGRALAGIDQSRLAREVKKQAQQGFELLERGLSDYATAAAQERIEA